jgi:Flp pilus assembly protein TadG
MYETPHKRTVWTKSSRIHRVHAGLRGLRADGGQALVEFALVAFPLLLVVLGIVTFGRAMNYDEQETHLVNEAARFAAVNQKPPTAGKTQTLGDWVRSQVDSPELKAGNSTDVSSAPQVCVTYPSNGDTGVGAPVRISMTFTFNWLPFFKFTAASTAIQQTATMRIEVPPTGSFFASGCS